MPKFEIELAEKHFEAGLELLRLAHSHWVKAIGDTSGDCTLEIQNCLQMKNLLKQLEEIETDNGPGTNLLNALQSR